MIIKDMKTSIYFGYLYIYTNLISALKVGNYSLNLNICSLQTDTDWKLCLLET